MGAWLSSRHEDRRLPTGFDSGSTLDYVYENEARGAGPIGRMIDRTFLDAIGWRGIRQRKLHLEELIGSATETLKAAGRTVHIARHRRRPWPLRARRHRQMHRAAGQRAPAGLFRHQCRHGPQADRRAGPADQRLVPPGRRLRRRDACRGHRAGAGPGHRLRPLRTVSRQRPDRAARSAGWPAPCSPAAC